MVDAVDPSSSSCIHCVFTGLPHSHDIFKRAFTLSAAPSAEASPYNPVEQSCLMSIPCFQEPREDPYSMVVKSSNDNLTGVHTRLGKKPTTFRNLSRVMEWIAPSRIAEITFDSMTLSTSYQGVRPDDTRYHYHEGDFQDIWDRALDVIGERFHFANMDGWEWRSGDDVDKEHRYVLRRYPNLDANIGGFTIWLPKNVYHLLQAHSDTWFGLWMEDESFSREVVRVDELRDLVWLLLVTVIRMAFSASHYSIRYKTTGKEGAHFVIPEEQTWWHLPPVGWIKAHQQDLDRIHGRDGATKKIVEFAEEFDMTGVRPRLAARWIDHDKDGNVVSKRA